MQEKENRVCLAVLPYIDNSYKSIHNKTKFIECIEQGMIYGEEAFIILAGGNHTTAKIAIIKEMGWILEQESVSRDGFLPIK